MDFDLSEDQREIRRVARELLAARSPLARVREAAEAREYDTELWAEMVSLGWPGIAVGERHGGQGLGAVELAVLAEELGWACAATPFLAVAAAAAVIDACGSEAQRASWLPGLVNGELTVAVGTPQLAIASGASPTDAVAVAVILEGGDARLVTSPAAEPIETIDPTRRFVSVAGGGEPLAPGAAQRIRCALAAEAVGIGQRALEMTIAYVNERRQFGVPVGSFQAVSHRCAEMLLQTESARSAAYYAAWAADASPELLPEASALAAAAASTAAREVPASAIQAHGGIGFTWEADVHWLYKRGEVDRALLGGAGAHHAALARAAAARLAPVAG